MTKQRAYDYCLFLFTLFIVVRYGFQWVYDMKSQLEMEELEEEQANK